MLGGLIKTQNNVGVTLRYQLSHKILLGSHGGVNFVTVYIVFVLLVYLEGISNITDWWPYIVRPYWPFIDYGRFAIWLYGHKYGQIGCLFKGMEKCRSHVEKLN